jgi:membrane protein required for colicin V production
MNAFDITLVGLMAVFTVIGVLRGMVREIISFAVWIVGTAVGWLFSPEIEPYFKNVSSEYALRMVLAFVALFAAAWIAGLVLGFVVQRFIAGRRGLDWPNRVLGGAIGVARGLILIVIAFLFAGITSLPQRPWWRDSAVAPHIETLARLAADYLPRDVARHIHYG